VFSLVEAAKLVGKTADKTAKLKLVLCTGNWFSKFLILWKNETRNLTCLPTYSRYQTGRNEFLILVAELKMHFHKACAKTWHFGNI
jgi:hypothetical protein